MRELSARINRLSKRKQFNPIKNIITHNHTDFKGENQTAVLLGFAAAWEVLMKLINKRTAAALIAGLLLILTGFIMKWHSKNRDGAKSSPSYTQQMFAMDAPCSLTLYGSQDFINIRDRISELDGKISNYGEDAEIAKLNKNKSAVISEDTENLIEKSLSLYEEYGEVNPLIGEITGLWNVTGENPAVPSDKQIKAALKTVNMDNIVTDGENCTLKNGASLDFGATGKGFALDEVKKTLIKQSVECAVISFGSSTLLYGRKPDGSPFKVSVANPENDSQPLLKFTTDSAFVSTSGGYERYFEADGKKYCHIFDEKTGKPVETDLTSVTVICASGIKSDFFSTRIFMGGTEELEKWLSHGEIQIIAVDKDRNVYCSDSLRANIVMNSSDFRLK